MRIATLCGMLIFTVTQATMPGTGVWIVDKESQLFIYGSTNINNFTCSLNNLGNVDTLEYTYDPKRAEYVFQKKLMTVPVSNFNCGNPLITHDFLQTLKAEDYPELEIRFLTLNQIATETNVRGKVEITLAGVSRQYNVNYSLTKKDNSRILLTGKQRVTFSDFDLEAPRKLMGMIRVQEALEVEFHMVLRPLP